jgi:3-hydroxy-9,10-secoandrosta-1,3,5(10)-triene-9,17-dione monooxygenase reductase component
MMYVNGATAMMQVDDREFRRALGHFATGVVVVTASNAGDRAGVTVNSFSSLSLQPPLVMFSLARNLRSFSLFQSAERIGVNILTADQRDISHRFAMAGSDKWAGTLASVGMSGAVLIDDALAHLECELHSVVDGGDHAIFICRVLGFRTNDGEPLMYFKGGYLSAAAAGGTQATPAKSEYMMLRAQ